MFLEIIATTVRDAVMAEQGGADRIELITAIMEGGLTPSLALIEKVRESVTIPVRVMVRPHARSFIYDEEDIEVMKRDITYIRSVGGLGVVMGLLQSNGTIDEENLKILVHAADGMKITFHRAFDEVRSQPEALEVLLRYPDITDILTSGGAKTAPEGAEQLAKLKDLTDGESLAILAGAGLTEQNLELFLQQSGLRRVHCGSAVRVNGDPLKPLDMDRLKAIRTLLNR